MCCRGKRRWVVLLLLAVAVVLFEGQRKRPTGAAAGEALDGPPPASRPAGDTLRVATFNIDGGVGKDDQRLDLDRTAQAISGFDLIGLQEVHGPPVTGGQDQAQILGHKLQMPWLYAPVERRWWRGGQANAVITSLAMDHWQRFPLATENSDSNRNVIVLRAWFAGRLLNVAVTHLARNSDGPVQLRSVACLFESMQEPAILMGDLNSLKDNPIIQQLRHMPGVADPIGAALNDKKPDTLDWIFARGLHAVSAGFVDNGASDHPVAWAELQLNK